MLLAGDVGGTKTHLAIFSQDAGAHAPLEEALLPSAQYSTLGDLLSTFLEQTTLPVDRASLGVAGPVVHGRARISNLDWTVDERELQKRLQLSSVVLLNDLVAVANAVPFLEPGEYRTLQEGEPDPGGAIAVIAPESIPPER